MKLDKIARLLRDVEYVRGYLGTKAGTSQAMKRLANVADGLADELPDCDTTDVRNAFAMLDLLGYKQKEGQDAGKEG